MDYLLNLFRAGKGNKGGYRHGKSVSHAADLLLLGMAAVYGIYALMAVFSGDPFLKGNGWLFLIYGAIAFSSLMEKADLFSKIWTTAAYALFAYGISLAVFGQAVATVAAMIASVYFYRKDHTTFFLTGALTVYWAVLICSSIGDIGNEVAPNIVNHTAWSAILYAFTYGAVAKYLVGWKLILLPIGGAAYHWLFNDRYVPAVKEVKVNVPDGMVRKINKTQTLSPKNEKAEDKKDNDSPNRKIFREGDIGGSEDQKKLKAADKLKLRLNKMLRKLIR